ncbi:MAG: M23 family metallopeptidase [Luteolibacter sp.]
MALGTGLLSAQPIKLQLPTENHFLFTDQPERFYMYVDRYIDGEKTTPWQGGAFGYVRSPIQVGGKTVMSRFHEGIDIAPIRRDKAGNPLDLIMSIADGTVVHTSPVSGRSNYGKYVVVRHDWEGSGVLSLYAHLAEITVDPGDKVKCGGVLGRMGYTGVGINRTRAHVHLELGFQMSPNYEEWHKKHFGSANFHGNFNGMNIAGVNISAFFLEHEKNPGLKFSEFVLRQPMQFKVTVPATSELPEFFERYPWMKQGDLAGAVSWEIGFAATGHAVSIAPSKRTVSQPVVSHVRPSDTPQRWLTRGLLTGEGNAVSLSSGGKNMLSLVMDDFL